MISEEKMNRMILAGGPCPKCGALVSPGNNAWLDHCKEHPIPTVYRLTERTFIYDVLVSTPISPNLGGDAPRRGPRPRLIMFEDYGEWGGDGME